MQPAFPRRLLEARLSNFALAIDSEISPWRSIRRSGLPDSESPVLEGEAMDSRLLGKIFGTEQRWQGPCTVIIDADAGIQTVGADSIGASATKSYAPRLVSARVLADGVCLLGDCSALAIIQQQKNRQPTGEEIIRQALLIIDPGHVVGVEFFDYTPLGALGLQLPPARSNSHPGTALRPV
jgi:hypothetical protein